MTTPQEHEFVVELGDAILVMGTPADNRTLLQKVMGESAPEEGGLLLSGIRETRKRVAESEGWYLPPIRLTDNSRLPARGVRVRFPPGLHEFEVADLDQLLSMLVVIARSMLASDFLPLHSGKIFLGHGRSHVWRQLQDFLERRLGLQIDEFDREPVAGLSSLDRLKSMLHGASFAFLIMTAEDEQVDGSRRARENVVHEVGLFQGNLGFNRAIVLLEDGCEPFSNIHGLMSIPFPRNNLEAAFEKVRLVLEREGLLR